MKYTKERYFCTGVVMIMKNSKNFGALLPFLNYTNKRFMIIKGQDKAINKEIRQVKALADNNSEQVISTRKIGLCAEMISSNY